MDTLTLIPFHENSNLLNELKLDLQSVVDDKGINISKDEVQKKIESICKWLSSTPQCIVFRINTLLTDKDCVLCEIKNVLLKQSHSYLPTILTFAELPEVIVIKCWNVSVSLNLERQCNEIIVDEACGAAVLRGAHVFSPGVIGIRRGLKAGEAVSVYLSSSSNCKKGCIDVESIKNKLFIGNGILRVTREQLFGHNINPSGIAVEMTGVISRVPQLNEGILPQGHLLLQNLPSIICSRILNPQINENILDMCAAPGNKSSHIAQLMNNTGILIALEKNKSKIEKLEQKMKEFGLTNTHVYCVDSITAITELDNRGILDGPPFSGESFDRILLDGPCSALGQRPQIRNKMSTRELRSFPRLQKSLFSTAIRLLKPGGTLVYSTCTITVAENEAVVAWALEKYPNLHLMSIPDKLNKLGIPNIASSGYKIAQLTYEQSLNLCRFDCDSDSGIDSTGFHLKLSTQVQDGVIITKNNHRSKTLRECINNLVLQEKFLH